MSERARQETDFIRSIGRKIPNKALESLLGYEKITASQWQTSAKYQIMLLGAFYKHIALLIPDSDASMHYILRQAISIIDQTLKDHNTMLGAQKIIKTARDMIRKSRPFDHDAYNKLLNSGQRSLSLLKECDISYAGAYIHMTNQQIEQRMNWALTTKYGNETSIWPSLAEIAASAAARKRLLLDKSNEALKAMEYALSDLKTDTRTAILNVIGATFDNFANQIEEYASKNNIPIHASPQSIAGLDDALKNLKKTVADLHYFYNDFERLHSDVAVTMRFDIAEARNRLAQIEQYGRDLDNIVIGLAWAESVRNIDGSFSLNHKIALYKQFANKYYQSLYYLDKANLQNDCSYVSGLNQQIITAITAPQEPGPSTLLYSAQRANIYEPVSQRSRQYDNNTDDFISRTRTLFAQSDQSMDLAQRAAHLLSVKMKFAFGKTVAEVAKDQCRKVQPLDARQSNIAPNPIIQGSYDIRNARYENPPARYKLWLPKG